MSREIELGPGHNPGVDTQRVLRYCYNSTQLYDQLRNHTSRMRNVCPVLFSDSDCQRMEKKWSDGFIYPDGIRVSFDRLFDP